MNQTETILFSPLNWGLGHATRIVPLINNHIKKGDKVIVAGNGVSIDFLKLEFPNLQFVHLANFKILYAPKPFFIWFLLLQMPFFYLSFWVEHYRLKGIIKKHKITTVISDNRYGLWNKSVRSILITHQLFIQLPNLIKFCEPVLHFITRKLINKFDQCWVPDYPEVNKSLAGKLSHGLKMPNNVKYIGPLSRFSKLNILSVKYKKNEVPDVLIVISGPEPQRTKFEVEMMSRFANTKQRVLMVCGKPKPYSFNSIFISEGISTIEHLNTNELQFYLAHSEHIIVRSGYSTIMDLHILGVSAEFIATPGQTEQEYLAKWVDR